MKQNYDMMIHEKVQKVFSVMEKRVSAEDMARIREAFELAQAAMPHISVIDGVEEVKTI